MLHRFMREVHKPLVELNVFDVRVWLAEMQTKVSLRTCENYRSYLSAFYMWLAAEGIVSSNIMAKIKPIKYEDKVKSPFSDVEIDALRSSCQTLRDRAILELLLSSGIRVTELCSLDIDDINLDNMTVLVREGKGGKQRTTFMNDVCKNHLQKYLESRKDSSRILFYTKAKTRLTKNMAENDLHRIGDAAKVANVHPHKCRRTFATSMYKRGMDVHTIQKLLGHSNINTTMCYISTNDIRTEGEYRRFS